MYASYPASAASTAAVIPAIPPPITRTVLWTEGTVSVSATIVWSPSLSTTSSVYGMLVRNGTFSICHSPVEAS